MEDGGRSLDPALARERLGPRACSRLLQAGAVLVPAVRGFLATGPLAAGGWLAWVSLPCPLPPWSALTAVGS
ncbi:MAG: hypothetical protein RDU89_02520 [bacterium]|nr:hypothetical protein [bacterium]